jgi:helicase
VLDELKEFNFVMGAEVSNDNPFRKASSLANDERLEATLLGRRVSELYIDPMTANFLIKNLEKTNNRNVHPFSLLQLISNTMEMAPGLYLRKGDQDKVSELVDQFENDLLEKPPNPWEIDHEGYMRSIKMAWLFSEWMDELGEDMILEKFGVTPGELRYRLNNADWLLYATQELGLLLKLMNVLKDIRKVRLRVKYGIREELLPLIRLKGVGRVRSRLLFTNNIRKLSDLRKIPVESLGKIVGPRIAKDLKNQLNEMENGTQKTI